MHTIVPQTYEDWIHCITVLCRIPLTPDHVDERIAALADLTDHTTQRFTETWGNEHLDRVQQWFQQAREELVAGART